MTEILQGLLEEIKRLQERVTKLEGDVEYISNSRFYRND